MQGDYRGSCVTFLCFGKDPLDPLDIGSIAG